MKIGFFDSGLGGLIILKAVAKALPQYDYTYYGDTKHLPYGDKTEEEIYEFSKEAMRYLFDHDTVLVIIACNTASAETLRRLQDTFLPTEYPDRKILGVIIPTIEELAKEDPGTEVLLLATKRTVESGKYEKELEQRGDTTITLTSVATPSLVPLIEAGRYGEASLEAIKIIDSVPGQRGVVILGCTHYTLLKDTLRDTYDSKIRFISQDEVIPEKLSEYLHNHPEITERLTSSGVRSIYLTEHRADYDMVAAQFLGGAYIPDE